MNQTFSLQRYADYTRKQVHDLLDPAAPFVLRGGDWGLAGIVSVKSSPGDFVFFVSFGQQQAQHTFDEGISREGILTWQSQPGQKLSDPRIKELITHDHAARTIRLLLRTSRSGLYTYLGDLAYQSHDPWREHPVYFKWRLLDWNPPSSVLDRIGLVLREDEGEPYAAEATSPGSGQRNITHTGQGFASDAATRRAVERRAVDLATRHFRKLGYDVRDVGSFAPYDLHCTRRNEELHVEVKGTTGDAIKVLLTRGEVRHHNAYANVALAVVKGIMAERSEAGVKASGGTLRVWHPWSIDPSRLEATEFEYRLET